MPRTISSAQTFIMKWVFPAVWIGGFGLATCALWLGGFYGRNGLPPELLKWDFLVAWLVGSGFIIWFCGRLKRVQIDGDTLYVSNYSSEVRIPLTEISHFTQSYLSRPPTITVHLRSMSPVGQRIVFIPKFRWVLFGTHPLITEMQALCDESRVKGGTVQHDNRLHEVNPPAMWGLQAICVFVCVLCIASAVTGIQSVVVTDHVFITRSSDLGRLYSILAAAFFAAVCYGVWKRAYIVWVLGWLVMAVAVFSFLFSQVLSILKQPSPIRWAIFCFVIGGIALVAAYWGMWWKRQRQYFCKRDDAPRR